MNHAASPPSPGPETQSALYRAVWRWHFYAGLFVAPFAILLAITGAIYLWKPQYEAWRYRALLTAPTGAVTQSAEVQFASATAAHPDATAITFTPAFTPGSTSETVLRLREGEKTSVYVDPATARVTGEVRESDRFMHTVRELHGTLLAGRAGEYVVEFAASWAIVLFLTGLYLWWPRPRFTVWGFLLPRLRAKGRIFWRDLHAVPAVWLAAATLFLLSTGLLWTKAAGTWYRTLSSAVGQGTPRESNAGAHRSELTGWSPPLQAGLANQLLGTLAALGVLLLAVTGLAMWWQRRPAGKLAAPANVASLPRPVFLGTLALAVFLPLLAASLGIGLILDHYFRKRLAAQSRI